MIDVSPNAENSAPRIADALTSVRNRIRAALIAANRATDEAQLIAVSKRKPVELIREAYAAGQRDFGENYVQELLTKAEACADLVGIRWHMIGHLQKNKARHTVTVASAVHSVDSVGLAQELGKRRASVHAETGARVLPQGLSHHPERLGILVEVNVGGELQKTGCAPLELPAILGAIEAEPTLELLGLMTVPPFTEQAEASLPYFEQLALLRERSGGVSRLPHLSMGMTHDLEYAIRAGSTLVRVGTAIFGERA